VGLMRDAWSWGLSGMRGCGLDAGCVATRWGELYEGRLVIVMSFEEDRRHVSGTKWLGGRYGVS
jgi:hypothetical protein